MAFTEKDEEMVEYLVNKPIDDKFCRETSEQDPLELLQNFQEKSRLEKEPNLTIFEEAHPSIPLKEYIRKWCSWVIDFHWLFTLKYFIELLPTNKLYYFIKNYPSLDNFVLHWMWWSYLLNKDLERFTKDPFRGIGSTPWLNDDIGTKNQDKPKERVDEKPTASTSQKSARAIQKQPSKFFQYDELTIKTIGSILFQSENNKNSININNSSTSRRNSKKRANFLKISVKTHDFIDNAINEFNMIEDNSNKSETNTETKIVDDLSTNDDMDKTVVHFDLGPKEEAENEVSSSKETNPAIDLKTYIEEKLNVKIESGKNLVENVEHNIELSIISASPQENALAMTPSVSNVVDKFFQSFNDLQKEDETKTVEKQNSDHLNRIIHLLNKNVSVKSETDDSDSLITGPVLSDEAIKPNESSNLIKLLLKIDNKDELNKPVSVITSNSDEHVSSSCSSSSIISPSSLSSAISSSKSSPNNLKSKILNVSTSSKSDTNSSPNILKGKNEKPNKTEDNDKPDVNKGSKKLGTNHNNNNNNNSNSKMNAGQGPNKSNDKETKSSKTSNHSRNSAKFHQNKKNHFDTSKTGGAQSQLQQQIPLVKIQAPSNQHKQQKRQSDQHHSTIPTLPVNNNQNKNNVVQFQYNQQQQHQQQQQPSGINKQLPNPTNSINSSMQVNRKTNE